MLPPVHHVSYLIAQAQGGLNSAFDIKSTDTDQNAVIYFGQQILSLLAGFQSLLLTVGGGAIILSLIFSGFKYITGDAKAGKSGVTAAIIGTAIVLLSYSIIAWTCQAAGSTCGVK